MFGISKVVLLTQENAQYSLESILRTTFILDTAKVPAACTLSGTLTRVHGVSRTAQVLKVGTFQRRLLCSNAKKRHCYTYARTDIAKGR